MSLRHGRSRSSSSIQSANESVFDILESNRCEAAEVEKRLSEVQQWLKKGREHSQSDIEACHVAVRTSLKRLKKMTSSYEQLFERLQAEQLQLRQVKDMELRRKAVEFEEELKFSESEYNKVLMTMSD
jgi:Skp family chaperone for outer membrane proteins